MKNFSKLAALIVYATLNVACPVFFGELGTLLCTAQQVPLYSQYYFNPFIYNPAYSGIGEYANANLINRLQWKDMPGGPQTTALTLDAPLAIRKRSKSPSAMLQSNAETTEEEKETKAGIGLSLFNDKTGYTERFGFYGSYAYQVSFSEDMHLQFGLSLGALDNRIDLTGSVIKDGTDPALAFQNKRETTVDGNFGTVFLFKDLDVGIAVPQIMGNKIKYTGDAQRMYYQLSRHYLASLKYTFKFGEEKDISFAPLIMMRFVPGAPFQFDVNGIFGWKDRAWLAVSYKSKYAIGVTGRMKFNNRLNLGYSFELITGTLSGFAGGSHEIGLGYSFDVMGKGMDEQIDRMQESIDSLMAAKRREDAQKTELYNKAILKGDSLLLARDFQGAIAAYQYALTLKPDGKYAQDKLNELKIITETFYNKAIADADRLFAQGRFEEAKAKYLEALKYKPDSEYARSKLNEIEEKHGKQYRDAIASADMFFAAKDYKRAKEMYEKALAINPNDEYAKKRLQELEKLMGEQEFYTRLVRSADSLYMAGKYDEARAKYQEALRFNPNDLYLRDIIAQIDKKKAGGGGDNIRLYKGSDFTDIDGNPVESGFYIVTASFKSIDNARKFIGSGNAVGAVFSKERKFYYSYTTNAPSYEDARKTLFGEVRRKIPDSWIFILR